jgi:hypothetical protein
MKFDYKKKFDEMRAPLWTRTYGVAAVAIEVRTRGSRIHSDLSQSSDVAAGSTSYMQSSDVCVTHTHTHTHTHTTHTHTTHTHTTPHMYSHSICFGPLQVLHTDNHLFIHTDIIQRFSACAQCARMHVFSVVCEFDFLLL